MTVDETGVHYYEPENKALSRQWVGLESSRSKKFKIQPSLARFMATVFWDAKCVIMLEFLPKKDTIIGVYNANLLDQLRTAIHEKRRGKLSKGVLLQQDNARPHLQSCNGCRRAKRVCTNTTSCLFAWPSSLRLLHIPKLEKDIRGCHFRSDEDVVTAVEEWVNGKDPDFFSPGLMALEHSCSK